MRRYWILLLVLVLPAGCSKPGSSTKDERSKSSGVPTVYVVNYPLEYFAERIGGDLVNVVLPAPADGDPAYWKPGPEEVGRYQEADMILLNGASYAGWVDKASLPQAKTVDTSKGFREQFISLEKEVTHSHGPEGQHAHGGVASTTWLDPMLAIEQARAILDAFAVRWPEHRAEFEAGFAGLEKDLHELDAGFEAAVADHAGAPIVFSHPVYQYLERRYGLNGRSVHWEPGEIPDDKMWAELKKILADHPAKWMVWEGKPAPETASKLEEMGVRSVVFDPCGNVPETGDFLSVMRENVTSLRTALTPESK